MDEAHGRECNRRSAAQRVAQAAGAMGRQNPAPFAVESALSGVGRLVRPNQILWYRRTFEVPAAWQGRRILLHCEAVDWHCVVLVNGRKVGENKGGYVPFSFDITPALNPAGPQEVVLAVWDSTGDQALGKQSLPEKRAGWRYTPTTGIWQPVWLEPVPDTSIAHSSSRPTWTMAA